MLIAQISDIHIVEKGRKTLGVAPMETNLITCVAQLNSFEPRPDVVLITGDITDNGLVSEVENAAQILSELKYPYYIIPGNHDNLETLWQGFGGANIPAKSEKFQNYVIEGHDVRLIGMDSTIPNAHGGELCEERLAWLAQRLAEAPTRPTIIFMHHPPVKCSILETDEDGFIGADKLGKIIGQYENIERILCGHIHLTTHTKWNGTIVSTSPGNGMRLGLDLSMKKQSKFYLDSPAFQLHHWTKQKNLITHTVHIRDKSRPYPFEEQ